MALAAATPTEQAEDVVARHLIDSPYPAARTIAAWDALADERAVYGQLVTITGEAAAGNLRRSEELLMAQAVSLDAVFHALARRARANLDHAPGIAETALRLALRAQSQSRATLEALGALLHPPTAAFIRQHGDGNTAQVLIGRPTVAGARGESPPSELLDGGTPHGERLDGGTSRAAIGRDSRLAPVDALHGAAHAGREGDFIEERLPGRREAADAGDR
jgi:hypothetical protein